MRCPDAVYRVHLSSRGSNGYAYARHILRARQSDERVGDQRVDARVGSLWTEHCTAPRGTLHLGPLVSIGQPGNGHGATAHNPRLWRLSARAA